MTTPPPLPPRPRAARLAGATLALALAATVAGCENAAPRAEGGPDMRFITSSVPVVAVGPGTLLPLAAGTVWQMTETAVIETVGSPQGDEKPVARDIEVRVVGPAPPGAPGAGSATLVEVRRDGHLWRREIYRDGPQGLFLLATAEEGNPYMAYEPAVPLARYPLAEGQSLPWRGRFVFKGQSYPATAFSRVSAIEPVATATAKPLACRIDTQIIVSMNGSDIKFPTARWLAPGIGFAQRIFVNHGAGLYAQLVRVQRPSQKTP